jgi:hypothetical protein
LLHLTVCGVFSTILYLFFTDCRTYNFSRIFQNFISVLYGFAQGFLAVLYGF